jgi:ABC-2 type transport system ATP-binding protein
VLDRVGFSVGAGRVTGFVGANGAGKTTTMRIVLGVLAADDGRIRWQGHPVTSDDRRTFGYMPEERGLYPKMRLLDQLVFLGQLHGLEQKAARVKSKELLNRLDLGDRAHDRLDQLSLGNQQRVQVAAALAHDPALLVLDEPFSGLDPLAVDAMTTLLREQAATGVPVLFSSHQLDLVERICDDLVIIADGRVVAAGPTGELRAAHAGRRYRLVVGGDAGWVRDVPHLKVFDVDGPRALLEFDADEEDQVLLHEALRRGPVREFSRVVPPLSEIYREVTR